MEAFWLALWQGILGAAALRSLTLHPWWQSWTVCKSAGGQGTWYIPKLSHARAIGFWHPKPLRTQASTSAASSFPWLRTTTPRVGMANSPREEKGRKLKPTACSWSALAFLPSNLSALVPPVWLGSECLAGCCSIQPWASFRSTALYPSGL